MKDVKELDNYELLYSLISQEIGAKTSAYSLYHNDVIFQEVSDRYSYMYPDIDNDNKSKLFKRLYNDYSYQLLNVLIEKLITNLKEIDLYYDLYEVDNRDDYFYNNMDKIITIIKDEYKIVNKGNVSISSKFPKMKKEKVIYHVKNILDEIDSNSEWKSLYNEAIHTNVIFYLNEITKDDINRLSKIEGIDKLENGCMIYNQNTNEVICMLLDYTETIYDIPLTIHEVIHYINRRLDNGRLKPILRELPSIFYEQYSIRYLEKLGYDKDIINSLKSCRKLATASAYECIKDIIFYLELYLRDGIIDYDNAKGNCIKKRDTINSLIKKPYLFYNAYPYIIDSYLASRALDNIDDDKMLLSIMKYVTENISKINIEDVFNILNVDNSYKKIRKK